MVKAEMTGETEYRDAYLEELVREIVDEPLIPSENTSYLEETMHHGHDGTSNDIQNYEQPENCTDVFICSVCHENVRDADMCRHHEIYHPEISWDVNLFQLIGESCEETPDEQLDVDDETEQPEAIESPEQPRQSFICVACGAHVYDVDVDEHHTTYHSMIPFETNLFLLNETPSCGEQPIGPNYFCHAYETYFGNEEQYTYHVEDHDKYRGISCENFKPIYYYHPEPFLSRQVILATHLYHNGCFYAYS